MPNGWPGTSALVVAVPALEDWVRRRSADYDPAYVSAETGFAHAHITLLAPFADPVGLTASVRRKVGSVLARHGPFTARLDVVDTFRDGMIHLVPEPEGPFRRLTAALVAAFPTYRPYAGAVADPRPHLSLDLRAPGIDASTVRSSVAHLLPAVVDVTRVRLSWYEEDACRTLATWPLKARAPVCRDGSERVRS